LGNSGEDIMAVDYDGVIVGGTVQAREVAASAARQGARVALVEAPGEVEHQTRRQLTLEVLAQAADDRQQQFCPEPPPPITASDWSVLRRKVALAMDIAYPQVALEALALGGVDVVQEPGQFVSEPGLALATATRRLTGRGYLLSPPTQVRIPAIPGLAETPVLTPEALFDLEAPPEELAILGRSPDAIALAQALALLGVVTTLITRAEQLVPTEDPDISRFIESLLLAAGVDLRLQSRLDAIHHDGGYTIQLASGEVLKASHLLVATSRQPQLEGLNLDRIHLHASDTAIAVDDQLTTSRPRCVAFGPCLGGYWADHTDHGDGQIALGNVLYLPWRRLQRLNRVAKMSTVPEFARFGMTARQALTYYGDAVQVIQVPYGTISKFHLDNRMTGFCRCIIHQNGSVLGAQIVASNSADLAQSLALLARQNLSIQHMGRTRNLPMTDLEILDRLREAWQKQRWQPGFWRRDWAENWFNWRRSRLRN
jgi:pyruvate/2-oxoglutarate dehydrogenase complex dihydrolipoamide dehydrogenase (E3) component